MKEQLTMLVELQRLDDELRDTRESRARLEKLKAENAEALKVFDTILGERAVHIAETREFCAEKEAELKGIEDDLRRSRARLPSITSQRELTALNKELDTSRRNNLKRNEELLKLMQQLEEVEADHRKKQVERDALATQMTQLERRLADGMAAKEAAAGQHNARREAVRSGLDRQLVARYDRISRGRGGYALAHIVGGSCGACNVNVPPQVFIRLQQGVTLEACNNCQRLLVYIASEAAEQAV